MVHLSVFWINKFPELGVVYDTLNPCTIMFGGQIKFMRNFNFNLVHTYLHKITMINKWHHKQLEIFSFYQPLTTREEISSLD